MRVFENHFTRSVTPRADQKRIGRRICSRLSSSSQGHSGQRAGAATRRHRRKVRAQCLHSHRPCRQDDAGHAAGGDGPRRLHRAGDDPLRRTRWRLRRDHARACAAQRQALRQSDARFAGHRQFQLHSRVLEAAAHGRRSDPRDADRGRGNAMAGRSGNLHRVERQGHARRERTRARLRRSGRCGGRAAGSGRSAPERPKKLHPDRQAAQALTTRRTRPTARSFTASIRCCPE